MLERERESNSLQDTRKHYLKLIDSYLKMYCDLTELGGEYFFLQPDNCDYCIGSPTEQAQWHVNHINKCLTDWNKIYSFKEQLISLIERKGKEFDKKKEAVVKKIAQTVGLEDWEINKEVGSKYVYCGSDICYNCLNSQQLSQKEQEWLAIAKEVKRKKTNGEQSEAEWKEKQRRWKEENQKWEEKWQKEKPQRDKDTKNTLISLLTGNSDLASLEEGYRIVKGSHLYSSNKTELDNLYTTQKKYLESKTNQGNNYQPPKNDSDGTNDEEGGSWEKLKKLADLLKNSQSLTELENNYQIVKNSSFYNNKRFGNEKKDNKTWFDGKYEHCKRMLTDNKDREKMITENSQLEKIKEFFKERKIKQITWESGKIKIVYENSGSFFETSDTDNDPQIQALKKYLQDNNKKSLTWEELSGTSQKTNESKKPKDTNSSWAIVMWWMIAIVLVIVLITIEIKGNRAKSLKKTKKDK